MNYYLAIDIGASSGRHILFCVEDKKLKMEEVHRFKNHYTKKGNYYVWDTKALFSEIIFGLKKCKEIGKIPVSVGIDTWGVDYALLDENRTIVGDVVAYRDERTKGMDREVNRYLSDEELYARTGIQKAEFNTIYQLMAWQKQEPKRNVKHLLMMPDYLHFLLSGNMQQEYTNATTTGLVNVTQKTWDYDLIARLGFPKEIFRELSMPGNLIGNLTQEVQKQVGFDCKVVSPATHDTASAILCIPLDEESLYLSSGTWSLLGCESPEALTSESARKANFTNEGGYGYRYRFLKNIMGLWMIQSVQRELAEKIKAGEGSLSMDEISFSNLGKGAKKESIASIVDVNDRRFLAPKSMIEEIQKTCKESNQEIPQTAYELAKVVYDSLAFAYKQAVEEIGNITNRKFTGLYIVGGGSNAAYLNEKTKELLQMKVITGISEATAIGNGGAQMIANREFSDLADFREMVKRTFL